MKMMLKATSAAVFAAVIVYTSCAAGDSLIQSPQELTKDQMESCQANLCLGETGKDLAECQSPLKKLKDMKPSKRPDFLKKCPITP